ncbi:Ran-binding protein 9 [Geranomyces variabilis]|nr:Ran-binding protein 9 [Geranomyces variabilis]
MNTSNVPSQWNALQKSKNLGLSADGIRITYTGLGKQDMHAALADISDGALGPILRGRDQQRGARRVHRDRPMHPGHALGTSSGWEQHSWGYHGDDGCFFRGSGRGDNYGLCFTTGDVIGCIVNFGNGTVSFTKKGAWLGDATRNVAELSATGLDIYLCVGLRSPGEIVQVNLGQMSFVFDIEKHVRETPEAPRWI